MFRHNSYDLSSMNSDVKGDTHLLQEPVLDQHTVTGTELWSRNLTLPLDTQVQ